jgi:3-oxoacyl-[acyl-carrier-protein] synthase I
MTRSAHIVALAARTPVGLIADSTAAAIRARVSRVVEHPSIVDVRGEPLRCGRVPGLATNLDGARRLTELVHPVLHELLDKLPQAGATRSPLPTLLAFPEPRPGFSSDDAAQVLRSLRVNDATAPAPVDARAVGHGHAGVLEGLHEALELIASGTTELCAVGGVDSYLHADTIDWLDAELRLARDGVRGGFPPGEGCAMLALASDALRRQLALPSLGVVRAVACAREPRDETAPEGLLGEALADVYWRVGSELRQPHERIDDVYCDMSDERARRTDYGFALLRTGSLFRDGNRYITPVGQVGDLGAASAALNCVLASRAWSRGYARGPLALVSGASWGGLRGAALLQRC